MSIKDIISNEYIDDLLVRMAHNSTALEGNTISQADTISILLYNHVPQPMSTREFYEVANYKSALRYLLANEDPNVICLKTIRDYHRLLMENILRDNGEFKSSENKILGASFATARVFEVPSLLQAWCDKLENKLITAKDSDEKIGIIMAAHIAFERIHPFSDGNGRTGRILMVDTCIRHNIAPIIIPKEEKAKYISLLNSEDCRGFTLFGMELAASELVRIELFNNKRKGLLVEEEPSLGLS